MLKEKAVNPKDGDATIAYRGYLIRRNALNGLIWVEKDGFKICFPFCFEDARHQIDTLAGDCND